MVNSITIDGDYQEQYTFKYAATSVITNTARDINTLSCENG